MVSVGLLAFLGAIICIIGLIVAMFRKRSKKKWGIGIGVCFVLFFIALIMSPSAEKPVHKVDKQALLQKKDNTINLSSEVKKISDNKYEITFTTNLPNNFEVMATLSNNDKIKKELNLPDEPEKMTDQQFKNLQEKSYRGQEKGKIQDGKFKITFSGKSLFPGEYELELSSPLTRFQPESIQKLIGEKGEKLTGKYIIKDNNDNRLNFSQSIILK